MSAIFDHVASFALPYLIDALVTVVTGGLGLLFAHLHKTKTSEAIDRVIWRAETIVDKVVAELEQTVVPELKKDFRADGKLDQSEREYLQQLALDRVVTALGDEAKLIAPSLITSMIEAAVLRLKSRQ